MDDESQYEDAGGLATYLNTQLASAFGPDKVTVGTDETDPSKLVFSTVSNTSTFSVASSDTSGVLGADGALHIEAGDTNRIRTSETLGDLAADSKFGQTLKANSDGNYSLSVNGKNFTFTKDQTIGDVMDTINNDPDAGVTVSYSSTLDTFSIVADETGAQGKIDFQDEGTSTLASALFGKIGTTGSVNAGTDLKMDVSINGVDTPIDRSTNAITLDGLNLVVSGTTSKDDPPITFSSPSSTDDLYKKMSDFVSDYNNIISTINSMMTEKPSSDSQYSTALSADKKSSMTTDEITDWENNAKKGILQNDPTLEGILSDFRSSMTGMVSSLSSSLSQIGITTTTDFTDGGKLQINQTKFNQAVEQNPDLVQSLFTSTDGIATRMKNTMDKYVSGSAVNRGILLNLAGSSTYSDDTMDRLIKNYQSNLSDLNTQLSNEENRYYSEFTAMETALGQMNSQFSSLSSMLGGSSNS